MEKGVVKSEIYRSSGTPTVQKTEEKPVESLSKEQLEAEKSRVDSEIAQTTQAESSTPTEGENAVVNNSETTPETKPHEAAVPYERFKEVNDELKALRTEVAAIRTQQTVTPKEKTWDDLSVEELRKARAYYREQANDEGVDFVNEHIASRMAHETVKRSEQERQFDTTRVSTWREVVGEFPDLGNPQSEHYLLTAELVRSDPRLNREADGHAAAARIVAARIMRQQIESSKKTAALTARQSTASVKTNGLESGRRGNASSGSLEKLRELAESSGNPRGLEWRQYLSALGKAKKVT